MHTEERFRALDLFNREACALAPALIPTDLGRRRALTDRLADLADGAAFGRDIPAAAAAPLLAEVLDLLRTWGVEERPAPVRFRRTAISSWSALLAYVKASLAYEGREQFRVLFLDKKNQVLADELMGQGSVDHAPVYPREVARRALELDASAVILMHNHPSGDPTPSAADIDMTRQVIEALKPLRITVHDHLVIGREGIASFKALGLI